MNLTEFSERYPALFKCLNALSFDNGMSLLEDGIGHEGEPFPTESELYHLETLAGTLSDEEINLMSSGEEDEREIFTQEKGLQVLDEFLASAFDGDLQNQFFQKF